jgi:hypothetical protein
MAAPPAPAAPLPIAVAAAPAAGARFFSLTDIPRFAGRVTDDPDAWAADVLLLWNLAQIQQMPAVTFVDMVRLRLAGSARQFLEREILDNQQAGNPPLTVQQAVARMQERFVRPDQQIHLRHQLQRLRQTGSVLSFNEAFDNVRGRLTDASDEEVKAAYLNGLRLDIKRALIGANLHATVDEIMQAAVRADELLPLAYGQPQQLPRPQPPAAPAVPAIPGHQPPPPAPVPAPLRPALPRLTDQERQQLLATGGCFRCRQPGHISSACPNARWG